MATRTGRFHCRGKSIGWALLIPYAMSPVSTYDIHAEIIFVLSPGHGFLTLVVFCFS